MPDMSFLNRILSYWAAREAKPPEPADSERMDAIRAALSAKIEALRQRLERERELRRQLEEERRRREAKAAAHPESSRVAEPERRYSVGSRNPIGYYSDIASAIDAIDPRAFSCHLTRAVRDVYGGDAVAFYTAAGISRSAYSKIISHPDRHPAKDTVLAMAAALKMNLPDAEHFLRLAGYALSDSIPADVVWRACFLRSIHHLPQIRELLAEFAPANPAPSAPKP